MVTEMSMRRRAIFGVLLTMLVAFISINVINYQNREQSLIPVGATITDTAQYTLKWVVKLDEVNQASISKIFPLAGQSADIQGSLATIKVVTGLPEIYHVNITNGVIIGKQTGANIPNIVPTVTGVSKGVDMYTAISGDSRFSISLFRNGVQYGFYVYDELKDELKDKLLDSAKISKMLRDAGALEPGKEIEFRPTTIQVSYDARYMFVGDQNSHLACYELAWPRLLPYEPVLDRGISPLGGVVIGGGEKNYDAYMFGPNGNMIWSIPTGATVNTVAISDDGKYSVIASGSTIYFVGTYDSVHPRWSYTTTKAIQSVDMSADGSCVVLGDADGKIMYWSNAPNLSGSNPAFKWSFTSIKLADILAISISDDGTRIGAGGKDSKIYFFNENGALLWESAYAALKDVLSVAVSNDGRYLVAGTKAGNVYYFNEFSSTPLWQYSPGHDIKAVAITYYGEYVAAGGDKADINFFDAKTGTLLWSYEGHANPVDIELSYGGRYMTSVGDGGRVYYWDTRSSSPLWSWKTGDSKLNEIGMSEDGSIVVAGGDNGLVYYWFGAYSLLGTQEGGSKKYGAGPAWTVDLGKVKTRAVAVNSVVGPWVTFTKTDVFEHVTLSSDTEIVFVDANNNMYEGSLSMAMDTVQKKIWHVENRGWYQYPETGRIDLWDQVKLFFTYPGEPYGVGTSTSGGRPSTLPLGTYQIYVTLRGIQSDGSPYSQQVDAGKITIQSQGVVTTEKISSISATPYAGNVVPDSTTVSGSYIDLSTKDDLYWKVSSYPSFKSGISNPSNIGLLAGNLLSGSFNDLAVNDGIYYTITGAPVPSANTYFPASYSLLGGTQLVSGTVANLISVDGNVMEFQSYPVSPDQNQPSKAYIAYASNTGTIKKLAPKTRTWTEGTWSAESELATTGADVLYTRMATHPIDPSKRIFVTVSTNGYLTANVMTADGWVVTSNIGFVGNNRNFRGFDVTYEETTGKALLVYAISTSDTAKDLAYRVWDGSAWSAEMYINDPSVSDVEAYWVTLASKPTVGSNEIGLLYVDGKQNRVNSMIWSGSGWGDNSKVLSGAITNYERDRESIALAYEQTTGNLMIMCAEGDLIRWNRWTGTVWGTSATFDINTGVVKNTFYLTLKANPQNNQLMALSIDDEKDLCTAYWNGAAWSTVTIHDVDVSYKDQRCADVAWENTGDKAILVWSTDNANLQYRIWSSATWASTVSVPENDGKDDRWIQLRRNPQNALGDIKIIGASLNDDKKLRTFKWDGTNLIVATSYITLDSISNGQENFELEFQRYGAATNQKVIVELTGFARADMTEMIWTISQFFDTSIVDGKLQLYNYQAGLYPTDGDGFYSYTSDAANIMVTAAQTININPTYFRQPGTNQWKIRVTATKETATSFKMKVDLASIRVTYISSYKAAVEITGMTTDTGSLYKLEKSLDSALNVDGVTVTQQLYNYGSALYPTSGDGYLSYIPTANQDVTKTMTITSDPARFGDASGNWKMKVTAEKSGASSFDMKLDWSQLKHYWRLPGQTTSLVSDFTVNTQGKTVTAMAIVYWGHYDAANVNQTIEVYNWNTGLWDFVGDNPLEGQTYDKGGSEQPHISFIISDPGSYIHSTTNKVSVRISGTKYTITPFNVYANYLRVTAHFN